MGAREGGARDVIVKRGMTHMGISEGESNYWYSAHNHGVCGGREKDGNALGGVEGDLIREQEPPGRRDNSQRGREEAPSV